MFVKKATKLVDAAVLERILDRETDLLGPVKTAQDRAVVLLGIGGLLLENLRTRARESRVEQQDGTSEMIEGVLGEVHPADTDLSVTRDVEADDSSDGGDVMILLPNRMPRKVHLYMARLLGELPRRYLIALQLVQSSQQRNEICGRRPKTRSSGHVSHRRDLKTPLDVEQLEGRSNKVVLDLVDRRDLFVR